MMPAPFIEVRITRSCSDASGGDMVFPFLFASAILRGAEQKLQTGIAAWREQRTRTNARI